MKRWLVTCAAATACAICSPSLAAKPMTPPMDEFNNAFYTCDNEAAFLISYDSDRPKTATLTTSNNSKKYELKRMSATNGAEFAGEKAKFWTDGETVTVVGTEIPLQNCKRKTS